MSGAAPAHDHLVDGALRLSVTVAVGLTVARLAAWYAGSSAAMLGALVDGLTDLCASTVLLLAVRRSRRPADREHRYGHWKLEPLASLAQAAFVFGSALFVVLESVGRLAAGEAPGATELTLGVLVLGALATAALAAWQTHVVRRTGSLAVRADRAHYLGDAAANLAALAGVALAAGTGAGWPDALAGLAIALWLMRAAWGIGQSAVDALMDRELPDTDRARIVALVAAHPQTRGMHDLRTRSAGARRFIEFHLELDGALTLNEAHAIADALEGEIAAAFGDAEVTIHQEPAGLSDSRRDDLLA